MLIGGTIDRCCVSPCARGDLEISITLELVKNNTVPWKNYHLNLAYTKYRKMIYHCKTTCCIHNNHFRNSSFYEYNFSVICYLRDWQFHRICFVIEAL